MGVVESSLYQRISDTASLAAIGVILHGMAIVPPAAPVNCPIISIWERRKREEGIDRE